MIDGLFMGIGFTFALGILGFIRELIGSGTVLGFAIPGFKPIMFFVLPAGAFLTLGCLIAAVNWILGMVNERKGGNK